MTIIHKYETEKGIKISNALLFQTTIFIHIINLKANYKRHPKDLCFLFMRHIKDITIFPPLANCLHLLCRFQKFHLTDVFESHSHSTPQKCIWKFKMLHKNAKRKLHWMHLMSILHHFYKTIHQLCHVLSFCQTKTHKTCQCG